MKVFVFQTVDDMRETFVAHMAGYYSRARSIYFILTMLDKHRKLSRGNAKERRIA